MALAHCTGSWGCSWLLETGLTQIPADPLASCCVGTRRRAGAREDGWAKQRDIDLIDPPARLCGRCWKSHLWSSRFWARFDALQQFFGPDCDRRCVSGP